MSARHFLVTLPHGAELALQPRTVKRRDDGGSVVPRHTDPLFVMREVVQFELECVVLRTDQPPEKFRKFRFSVRSQSHDLVFVSIMGEAEIHRYRRVQKAERMRKENAIELAPRGSRAVRRERAGEVSHAVNRENRRVVKGGDEKSGGQVRLVMPSDAVKLRPGGRRARQPTAAAS